MVEKVFRFKQFSVLQSEDVFKVGTDGTLLAAIAPLEDAKSILDVGTGTGVVALMVAQRNAGATIVGIDRHEDAAALATTNFAASPWSSRLRAIHESYMDFTPSHSFDHILCNPPFFKDSLRDEEALKTSFRHEIHFDLGSFFHRMHAMSEATAQLSLILPFDRRKACFELAGEAHWNPMVEVNIRPFADREANRIVVTFGKGHANTWLKSSSLTLYASQKTYTKDSIRLLEPFLLHL